MPPSPRRPTLPTSTEAEAVSGSPEAEAVSGSPEAAFPTLDRRPLSVGERALAAGVFGPALCLDPIRINRLKWWMWQPAWITMAPDGHLWFHPNGDVWSADFSAEPAHLRGHFVHELTHVWQHQCGINLILKRPPFARYRYLPLVPGKPFAAYGLEQQADMVKDAYLLAEGLRLRDRPPLEAYRAILPFPIG